MTIRSSLGLIIALILLAIASAGAWEGIKEDSKLYLEGIKLSKAEAAALEAEIAAGPEGKSMELLPARQKLLSYYGRSKGGKEEQKKQDDLRIWLIRHHPEATLHRAPHSIFWMLHPLRYRRVKKEWEAQLKAHPDNLDILANLAAFYGIENFSRAEALLLRGRELEPNNSEWIKQLAQHYQFAGSQVKEQPTLGERITQWLIFSGGIDSAVRSQELAMRRELLAIYPEGSRERFLELDDAARAAYLCGERTAAAEYAEELLRMASNFRDDKGYGTAIYQANQILGHLALDRGDTAEAKKHLLAGGETPGAPYFDTFGLRVTLAERLRAQGE